MRVKMLFIGVLGIVLAWTMTAPPVIAGSPQQHRWEGAAIGVGAALLGGALYHQHVRQTRRHTRPQCFQAYTPRRHGPRHHRPRRSCGHWEVRKTWVPPVCEKTWNPGHYSRCKRWIPGRWISIEKQPGYWRKEKVWVPY